MTAKNYLLEFAVESNTELQAMDRLKSLGITNADEAKLSDLDRQAGLFIIKVSVDEAALTDKTYGNILAAEDVFILSDELSAKRAQEIIELTAPVEQQLKKLLICVLPETERVLTDIIETHQKHKSDVQPTSRIEWCRKINDFSFGELPKVLEEDISKLAKEQLLSSEGLLSLITSAKDFETLQDEIIEFSKPKTVWSSVNTILEKSVDYINIAGALKKLCIARNDAAHLNTITAKRLAQVEKDKKHVMQFVSKTKSNYRENLQDSMKNLSKMMNQAMDSVAKVDPAIFTEYQNQMSTIFKPLSQTFSKLNLDIHSSNLAETIKQNATYQSQVMQGFSEVLKNMQPMSEYKEIMTELSRSNFSDFAKNAQEEINQLQPEIKRQLAEIKESSTKRSAKIIGKKFEDATEDDTKTTNDSPEGTEHKRGTDSKEDVK